MRIFSALCYLFAATALFTGGNDFLQGLEAQRAFGSTLTDQGFADPLLDNVFRFFSGLWIGVGVLFVLFVRDLDRYKPAMIALLCIIILGGIGRIISISQYGLPDDPSGSMLVYAGLLAELVISPAMLWWLATRHHVVPG